jgi:hypothetical protein
MTSFPRILQDPLITISKSRGYVRAQIFAAVAAFCEVKADGDKEREFSSGDFLYFFSASSFCSEHVENH